MFGQISKGAPVALRLIRFDDAGAFAAHAAPFLLRNEAEHCLLLGITGVLARGGSQYTGDNYLVTVEGDDGIEGVALMTPPHGPVISRAASAEAVALVVDDLARSVEQIPTVLGPAETADAFAARWSALTGARRDLAFHERVHRLARLIPPKPAPGSFRFATMDDLDRLAALVRAFNREAFGPTSPQAELETTMVTARLNGYSSGFAFWEDGEAVALAGFGNPTPNGVMIGPVYTPPEFRNRGYATALTAALAQALFDRGRSAIFLFTDLANPASNHVYEKIGFEPVADLDQWRFASPAAD
jgi:predicted GNAT family acetyltransferase